MKSFLFGFVALVASAADLQPIFPAGAKPVGPYTPGIRAGSFVYISGQGALKPDGTLPNGIAAQTQQCLENVKAVLEAAGLTPQHVVYAQVYLSDLSGYEEMNRVWASWFTGDRPPARAVVGVARMPLDTRVEINAVAVVDQKQAKLVRPRGYAAQSAIALAVEAPGRLYVSGLLGRRADTNRLPPDTDGQVRLALDHLRTVVQAAGKRLSNLNLATVFITADIDAAAAEKRLKAALPAGYALIRTASLPMGANIEITAVGASDLRLQTARGTTEAILRGMTKLESAVVSNVYIDSIENFKPMNDAYAGFFSGVRPARTTVQPLPSGEASENQIAIMSIQ